jgi:general nucleoside transport system permease protein
MIDILFSAFRMSLPTMYASVGGYFSEKSGVAQIGLEAFLLTGAFTAASVTFGTHSLGLGYLSAGVMSVLMAQIFCYLVLVVGANSIVIGTGLNLFVLGVIPLVSKSLFQSTGSTPAVEFHESGLLMTLTIFAITILFSYWLSEKTLWGLQMKFAGEKKEALKATGISARRRQWQSISIGAFVTGLGGATLSTFLASSYSPQMSAGRGFIALAAVIFSGWNLPKALIVSLVFGLCEALQIQIQTNPEISSKIPGEFIQMIPYLVTLLALLVFKTKSGAPKEIA